MRVLSGQQQHQMSWAGGWVGGWGLGEGKGEGGGGELPPAGAAPGSRMCLAAGSPGELAGGGGGEVRPASAAPSRHMHVGGKATGAGELKRGEWHQVVQQHTIRCAEWFSATFCRRGCGTLVRVLAVDKHEQAHPEAVQYSTVPYSTVQHSAVQHIDWL
jgi:hypothetical protein